MVEVSTQCSEGSPSYPTNQTLSFSWMHQTLAGEHIGMHRRCPMYGKQPRKHFTRVRSHTQSHAPLAAEACGSDSPGCDRKLHCSILHQQAGWNTVNTAVQTDQEATPHVSGQPNSTPGTTHPREIERPCRHSVMPFPDVRYRMASTSICLPSTDTGIGNPIIGSVCNKVES